MINRHKILNMVKSNSPILLSGTAIVGVVSTAYLAARAAVESHKTLQYDREANGHIDGRKERLIHDTKLVWKNYVPATISGGLTIGCIVGNARISGKRLAATHAALFFTEKAYSEYRDIVAEEYGESKERRLRDELASRTVNNNPPTSIVMTGDGETLCCELLTKRYFKSDMEKLRRSVNLLNEQLLKQDQMSLDDWYDYIGLTSTSVSSDLGWRSEKLMELRFTSVLAEDGKPCLAFDYNYVRPLVSGFYE